MSNVYTVHIYIYYLIQNVYNIIYTFIPIMGNGYLMYYRKPLHNIYVCIHTLFKWSARKTLIIYSFTKYCSKYTTVGLFSNIVSKKVPKLFYCYRNKKKMETKAKTM